MMGDRMMGALAWIITRLGRPSRPWWVRLWRIVGLTIDVLAWVFVVVSFAAAMIPNAMHEDHTRIVHVKGGLIMLLAILIIRWADTPEGDAC